jgi:hypothetical protein
MYGSGVAANTRTPEKPPSLLLTVQEAAVELRVSKSTMFSLLDKPGGVPSMLLAPKIRRVERAVLEEYIATKRAEATEHQQAS